MIDNCEKCHNRRHVPDPKNPNHFIRCDCIVEYAIEQIQKRAGIPNVVNDMSWVDLKDKFVKRSDYTRMSGYAGYMLPQVGRPKKRLLVEWLYGKNEDDVLIISWMVLLDAIRIDPQYTTSFYTDLSRLIDLQFDNDNKLSFMNTCESVSFLSIFADNPKSHSYGGPVLSSLVRKRIRNGLPTLVASCDNLGVNASKYGRDVCTYFQSDFINRIDIK